MESQTNSKVSSATMDIGKEEVGGGVGMGRKVSMLELILRGLALMLTLAAAIVLGVDKQTKVVPIQITPTLPPFNVTAHAKWHYLSAYVYEVAANIIACSYAAVSIVIVGGSRSGKKLAMAQIVILLLDLVMVALLFSGNGAALAIGLIGFKGNSHTRWNKVCNVFNRFCDQVAVSIVLSMAGSLAFLLLVALAVLALHKKRCN